MDQLLQADAFPHLLTFSQSVSKFSKYILKVCYVPGNIWSGVVDIRWNFYEMLSERLLSIAITIDIMSTVCVNIIVILGIQRRNASLNG